MPVPTRLNGLFTVYVGPCVGPNFVGMAMFTRIMRVRVRVVATAFVRVGMGSVVHI